MWLTLPLASSLSEILSLDRKRAEHLWRPMRPSRLSLPKTEQSVSREDFVQTFWRFGRCTLICLQIPILDRCQYNKDLFKLRDGQPAKKNLNQLILAHYESSASAHYGSSASRPTSLAINLANLWKSTFQDEKTETLGAQLAAFLELIIEQGPSLAFSDRRKKKPHARSPTSGEGSSPHGPRVIQFNYYAFFGSP